MTERSDLFLLVRLFVISAKTGKSRKGRKQNLARCLVVCDVLFVRLQCYLLPPTRIASPCFVAISSYSSVLVGNASSNDTNYRLALNVLYLTPLESPPSIYPSHDAHEGALCEYSSWWHCSRPAYAQALWTPAERRLSARRGWSLWHGVGRADVQTANHSFSAVWNDEKKHTRGYTVRHRRGLLDRKSTRLNSSHT